MNIKHKKYTATIFAILAAPIWQFYVALGIIVISTFIMIKDTDEVIDSVK